MYTIDVYMKVWTAQHNNRGKVEHMDKAKTTNPRSRRRLLIVMVVAALFLIPILLSGETTFKSEPYPFITVASANQNSHGNATGSEESVDPDVFEEHNMDRQLLCTQELLGKKKVDAAAQRVAAINPAVRLQAFNVAFGQENSTELLKGVNVAADALDSIPVRLELAEACNEQSIPLVHGAIAGWSGHVAVQYPGENILQHLYAGKKTGHGVEKQLGNPSFTPAAIASLEVAEIVKILLNTEPLQPRRYLAIDLYCMEFTEVFFPDTGP